MLLCRLNSRRLYGLIIIALLSTGIITPLLQWSARGQDDWLTGWTYRKSHQITGSTVGAQTDYQVKIKVDYASGTDSGENVYLNFHCKADFGDVRFTDADGTTLLDYWLEGISGTQATFWVEIPSIPASPSSATIYVYYSNPTATTTSNGFDTFIRFADGTSGNFDENTRGTASLSHSGGKYRFAEDSVDDAFASGVALTGWGIRAVVKGVSELSSPVAGRTLAFGLIDQASVSAVCGDPTNWGSEARFVVSRVDAVYPQGVLIAYNNQYRWDGSSWVTSGGWYSTSGPLDYELRASSTTFYMDVLSGGSHVYPNPATIPISSVKGFTLGKILALTEPYTTHYITSGSVNAFFVAKYCDPEPAHGTWGTEEGPPTYSSIAHSAVLPGESCTFSVYWQDLDGLDTCIFSTNTTGVWQNETVAVSGTGSWANVTKTLPLTSPVVVGYRWYCSDTAGMWTDTGICHSTVPAWLSDWGFRKAHTIQGSTASAQSDYQVRVKVHYGSGTDSGENVYLNANCGTDFGDIRFTAEDGITQLNYWTDQAQPSAGALKHFAENGAGRPFGIVDYPAAIYYNSRTYVVWCGSEGYITYFDHTSGRWGGAVKFADGLDPGHGNPAIMINDEGKIIVAYDCHEYARIKISSNPEDISSWGAPIQVFNYATYHRFVKDSSGNIYLFVMHGDAADSSKLCYKKSSDGGQTWGPTNVVVDFAGSAIVYAGNAEYDSVNNRIHIGWCLYTNKNKRQNIYHAYLDILTGNMHSMDGTDLGPTISTSEADTYCKVVDTGLLEAEIPAVHLDSNGYPYIIDTYGYSGDYKYIFTRWTGSSWSTPQTITSTNSRFNIPDFIVHSPSNIEAYLITRLYPCWEGGDIEKWVWDGTSWSQDSIILTEKESGLPLADPMCVKNGLNSFKVVFGQQVVDQAGPGLQTGSGLKLYAHGDYGFVIGEDGGSEEAEFWVKIPSIPSSPDSATIYVYYGNPSATTTSDGFNTFIRFDDGTASNLDEDTKGTASLSHVNGKYVFTEDSDDDAFASGTTLTAWGIRAVIKGLSDLSHSPQASHTLSFGFVDQTSISDVCGDPTHWTGERRFMVTRSNVLGMEQPILTTYEGGTTGYRWDGSAWVTSGGWYDTSGPLDIEVRASQTTFYADVLSGGTSIYPNPATIPISSVKAFTLGNIIALTEPYTTHYTTSGSVDAFFVAKYCDPEPTHGTWKTEEVTEYPLVSRESPLDSAVDIPITLSELSFNLTDFQYDPMDYTVTTSPNVGSGGATGVGNGRYTVSISGLQYSTTYTWSIHATDGTHSTDVTYSFTTEPDILLSNPWPATCAACTDPFQGEIVSLNPTLSIEVDNRHGYNMDVIFRSDASGAWQDLGSYINVGDGTYTMKTADMKQRHKTYHWSVNALDLVTGKWTNKTYSFTIVDYVGCWLRDLGDYWCGGFGYAGVIEYPDTFYASWMQGYYYASGFTMFYAKYDINKGWVIVNSSLLGGPYAMAHTYGPGYWGDAYHAGFLDLGAQQYKVTDSTTWDGFAGHYAPYTVTPYLNFGNNGVASMYAFNNSYAWLMAPEYFSNGTWAIWYWPWSEGSGWGTGVPISGTCAEGGTNFYEAPQLLQIDRSTWGLYWVYNWSGSASIKYALTTDGGQTWSGPHDCPELVTKSGQGSRPSFARYGDNFYIFLVDPGGNAVCYSSTDGIHWGNKKIMLAPSDQFYYNGVYGGSFYYHYGVMLHQGALLSTASDTFDWDGTQRAAIGNQWGVVTVIPEMLANPGEPSSPYPTNGAVLPAGTATTRLEVVVHGAQTYDVAFYWADGTFIGEDKLLREGDTASVEVSGLHDDETYEWYAIARGAKWSYWNGEPATTSDENQTAIFTFGVGIVPELRMTPTTTTCSKYCEHFTLQINVTDVVNVEDFAFEIHYDTALMDYVGITWGTFLDGAKIIDLIDEGSGTIQAHIEPSTPVSGSGWLLNITFHASKTMIWKDAAGWTNKLEGKVWFHWAELSYQSSVYLRYEEWIGGRREITVNQVSYTFVPLQGDLDGDGDVDIFDLRTAAAYYNVKEGDALWPSAEAYDLNGDKIIDIFDLVIVAVKYGTKYDC
jgi:hypothetical protein